MFGAIGAALASVSMLVPRPPPPPVARAGMPDDELRALLASLRAAPPAPSRADRRLAALGRKLFADARLGPASCAGCHVPEQQFGGGQAPNLVNEHLSLWFGSDGRADSLAASVVVALEDPRQMGASRLRVVRLLRDHYRADYEELFGAFPAPLTGPLPADALPEPAALSLQTPVAAQALASLGSYPLLEGILTAAQAARRAPATELSRRAMSPASPSPAWTAAWAALPGQAQASANRVLANFGRATAAYLAGLAAVESPFDRFAARVLAGTAPREAFDTSFASAELAGLTTFAGSAGCISCHSGPAFSDQQFHNLGLSQRGDLVDLGRVAGVLRAMADPFNCLGALLPQAVPTEACRELPFLRTDAPELVGAFKTPSLRNVTRTAPYMHDGRYMSLAEVLRFYAELADRPAAGAREGTLKPLTLDEAELAELTAFLRSLASPVRDYTSPEAVSR